MLVLLQNQNTTIQSQFASIRSLEEQIGQIASVQTNWPQVYQASIEANLKGMEHHKAVTLRRVKEI